MAEPILMSVGTEIDGTLEKAIFLRNFIIIDYMKIRVLNN